VVNRRILAKTFLLSVFLVFVFVSYTGAAPFEQIRIGDVDGFGYGTAAGFLGADGAPANRTGGVLGTGDLLPDLDRDRVLATGSGDDFDNRSGEGITGSGFTDKGSTGMQFTDISLSTSYDASSAAHNVFNANTNSFGSGGPFPSPPSSTLPNQPGFVFNFFVGSGDITDGTPLFFNLVFGDYDVSPAQVDFMRADGTIFSKSLTLQPGNQDGLIQAAFANLAFTDVFTATAGGWNGFLKVDFNAPNEPYTAFDFAEIGTTQIPIGAVPEPSTLLLFGSGLAGLVGIAWRRRHRS
jgi:hypothetical protein